MNTIGKKIEPEVQPESEAQVVPETSGVVLGSLAHDDAQLGGISTPAAPDLSKAQKDQGATPNNNADTNDTDDEALTLPKGAIVSMCVSGGLRFSSRTVTVHRDGQITQSSTTFVRGLSKGAPSRLSNDELSNLKIIVSQAGLDAPVPPTIGTPRQQPDAYAYEIVARVGTKQTSVEVFDGSVPERIKPLIRELSRLMAKN